MKIQLRQHRNILLFLFFLCLPLLQLTSQSTGQNYPGLVELYRAWRSFEAAPLLDGVPDYRPQTFEKRANDFNMLRERLSAIDTAHWPLHQQVDWHLVNAEMNGYDFNQRVLKPWSRDPAFYKTLWMSPK